VDALQVDINVSETIMVADDVQALPVIQINVNEHIGVTDAINADALRVDINVAEAIGVSESVLALPVIDINVNEQIGVTDNVNTEALSVNINIDELISVADTVDMLPSVMINISELINVNDIMEVIPVVINVSGAGYNYPEPGYRASLSLDINSQSMETGWINYYYTKLRLNLESTLIIGMSVNGNTVTVTGEASVNGVVGYTFEVTIIDGNPDLLGIIIYNPDGSIYFDSIPTALNSGDFVIDIGITTQFNLMTYINPSFSGSIIPDCSNTCSYDSGTLVTLTANKNTGYEFSGWTGCDDPSAGSICTMTMDADKDLTANFTTCLFPIRVDGIPPVYYPTIQQAVTAAEPGETVQVQAGTFIENIDVNNDVLMILKGGYGCNFSTVIGTTTLRGNITINLGTVVIEDFEISE